LRGGSFSVVITDPTKAAAVQGILDKYAGNAGGGSYSAIQKGLAAGSTGFSVKDSAADLKALTGDLAKLGAGVVTKNEADPAKKAAHAGKHHHKRRHGHKH
jgi:hypothetical protein